MFDKESLERALKWTGIGPLKLYAGDAAENENDELRTYGTNVFKYVLLEHD